MVTDFMQGRKKRYSQSSCRDRSAAQQQRGVSVDTQVNVSGYRKRIFLRSRQDCYEFVMPQRATELMATTPAIGFDLLSSV